MVRGLDHMSYDKRLKVLGLLSHEQSVSWGSHRGLQDFEWQRYSLQSSFLSVVSHSQHTQRSQHETVYTRG